MTREFVDVHDRHCCKRHGCKYWDPNCTVVNGPNRGITCEECYESPEITDIFYARGYINWSWPGIGFGQLSFSSNEEDIITIDDECMGKERTRKIMYALVDKLIAEATFR